MLLGVAAVMTSAVTLAASALIVSGTGTHNVNTAIGYKPSARDHIGIRGVLAATTTDLGPVAGLHSGWVTAKSIASGPARHVVRGRRSSSSERCR